MSKKIIVDSDLCIGCGSCEAIAPEHFGLKDDGKSHVKKQYTPEDEDVIKEAIDGCPVKAISLVEEKESEKTDTAKK